MKNKIKFGDLLSVLDLQYTAICVYVNAEYVGCVHMVHDFYEFDFEEEIEVTSLNVLEFGRYEKGKGYYVFLCGGEKKLNSI